MKKLLVIGIAAMAVATLSARADDAKTTYDSQLRHVPWRRWQR